MYQEFNEVYLRCRKFLPQKLSFWVAYKVIQRYEEKCKEALL